MEKIFKVILVIEIILFFIFVIGYIIYEKKYYDEHPNLTFSNCDYFPESINVSLTGSQNSPEIKLYGD